MVALDHTVSISPGPQQEASGGEKEGEARKEGEGGRGAERGRRRERCGKRKGGERIDSRHMIS